MPGILDGEKSLSVYLLVSILYTNVTDGQTDTARRHRPLYAYRVARHKGFADKTRTGCMRCGKE